MGPVWRNTCDAQVCYSMKRQRQTASASKSVQAVPKQVLQPCTACGGSVPTQIWQEHCAGKKHKKNLAKQHAQGTEPAAGEAVQHHSASETKQCSRDAKNDVQGGTQQELTGGGRGFGKKMKTVSAPEIPIPISNKGHQMMLKLGWSGGVLGASGTGLAAPITASTMYRGRIGLGGPLAFPDL